jgi:glutaredoxin/glutathione-dependent peroxiredoxin
MTTISIGSRVPAGKFKVMGESGPAEMTTEQLFAGKRVLVFSVPGAFTPTCSQKHLPGYISKASELKAKGIDTIACMAVNDVFVMDAWGKSAGASGKVQMLADGNGEYARALGLELDATGFGMGLRGKRFAMVVNNGVLEQLEVEAPGQFKVSAAEEMLCHI